VDEITAEFSRTPSSAVKAELARLEPWFDALPAEERAVFDELAVVDRAAQEHRGQ
jgi:hypothetical protein